MWCRRTDELVDGPNASYITPTALDRWEKRLDDLFKGRPYDMYDAALSDTISNYPVDIQVLQFNILIQIFYMLIALKQSRSIILRNSKIFGVILKFFSSLIKR